MKIIYLFLPLIDLCVDANGVENLSHFFGVDTAVVCYILLTSFVDVHVACYHINTDV